MCSVLSAIFARAVELYDGKRAGCYTSISPDHTPLIGSIRAPFVCLKHAGTSCTHSTNLSMNGGQISFNGYVAELQQGFRFRLAIARTMRLTSVKAPRRSQASQANSSKIAQSLYHRPH